MRRKKNMTFTAWRNKLRDGLSPVQDALRPSYEEVRHCQAYSSWLIPGMLQTRGYIEAIFGVIQGDRGLSDDDVHDAVESRLGRQQLMHSDGRRFDYLIEESVLRCGIGGPDVMQEQLQHLLSLVSSASITIGLLPMGPSRRRWPDESFWMFDASRVSVELISGELALTDAQDIAEYTRRFDQLAEQAIFHADAEKLIRQAQATLDQ
jgi:hypothetical protein